MKWIIYPDLIFLWLWLPCNCDISLHRVGVWICSEIRLMLLICMKLHFCRATGRLAIHLLGGMKCMKIWGSRAGDRVVSRYVLCIVIYERFRGVVTAKEGSWACRCCFDRIISLSQCPWSGQVENWRKDLHGECICILYMAKSAYVRASVSWVFLNKAIWHADEEGTPIFFWMQVRSWGTSRKRPTSRKDR